VPYYRPAEDSLEMKYLRKRREALGGPVPARRSVAQELKIPSLDAFAGQLKSTNDREISTTMAFVRMLTTLCKDKEIGHSYCSNRARRSRVLSVWKHVPSDRDLFI